MSIFERLFMVYNSFNKLSNIHIYIFTVPTVLDCTVGFPASEPEPTLWDAISGKKIRCAIIAR
jgi:hypothetical protein